LALCAVAAVAFRHRLPAFSVTIALAALFAGFSAGAIRARSLKAPVLSRIAITPITGFIEAVEDRDGGKRLLLRVVSMKDIPEINRPRLVRVSVRNGEGLSAGEFIAGTARLLPPPLAACPDPSAVSIRRCRLTGRCGWQRKWIRPAMP
jgi:competence protein ComEC